MSGPRVVAMGDSITLGVGDSAVTGQAGAGWAAHVASALGASTFENLAANGVRVREMWQSQLPTALVAQPDVVLATVGGNDVLRGDFDPADMTAGLITVVERLARPERVVVMATLDKIRLFDLMPGPVTTVMQRRIALANQALRDATVGSTVVVLDGAAIMHTVGRAGWHIDRIHPSPLGHRALATAALGALAHLHPQVCPVGQPSRSPRWGDQAWWLLRNGAPWIAKRSRDLIPHITQVVTHELLEDRRQRATAGKGGAGGTGRLTPPEERGLDQPAVLLNDV